MSDEALPEGTFVELDEDDPLAEPATRSAVRHRPQPLKRLPTHFARVPLLWFTKPPRKHLFGPRQRLFLLLVYRSHFGQRGVRLTNALAAEIGISRRSKHKCLQRLEDDGWIRVERDGQQVPTVWPIVISG